MNERARLTCENLPTDEQRDEIVEKCVKQGNERWKTVGREFNEADFLVGVLTMFEALGWWEKAPHGWTFAIMSGCNVLTPPEWYLKEKAARETAEWGEEDEADEPALEGG
jgi:hypothetical protein